MKTKQFFSFEEFPRMSKEQKFNRIIKRAQEERMSNHPFRFRVIKDCGLFSKVFIVPEIEKDSRVIEAYVSGYKINALCTFKENNVVDDDYTEIYTTKDGEIYNERDCAIVCSNRDDAEKQYSDIKEDLENEGMFD